MQRKRAAQEAFAQEKPNWSGDRAAKAAVPLSAFAAAKARAARHDVVQHASTVSESESDDDDDSIASFVPDSRDPASLLAGIVDGPAQRSAGSASSGDDDGDFNPIANLSKPNTIVAQYRPATGSVRPLSTVAPHRIKEIGQGIEVSLDQADKLLAAGWYDLKVIQGAVAIYGALLRPGQPIRRIWAPASHALPTIVAKTDAVVRLLHAEDDLASFHSLSPLWSRLWSRRAETDHSFVVLMQMSDDILSRNLIAIEHDTETDKMQESIASATRPVPCVLVVGPKGCGKSTLCRAMVNKLLTAPAPLTRSTCMWLDLDPGQSEFSPSGQISLVQIQDPVLGPPFTHAFTHPASSFRTIRSHAMAALSPKEDIDHFNACISDLIKAWKQARIDFPQAPLVINSSGWVSGAGLDILLHTLQQVSPTDLVLSNGLEPATVQVITDAKPPQSKVWMIPSVRTVRNAAANPRSTAELRQMQSMAYFHSIGESAALVCRPLDTIKPWRVRLRGRNPGLAGILSYHEPIPAGMAPVVLTGMTAALVSVQASEAKRILAAGNSGSFLVGEIPLLQPTAPGASSPPLDPSMSECLGQVLIRSIDTDCGFMDILTPIPGTTLTSFSHRTSAQTGHDESGNTSDSEDDDNTELSLFLVRGRFDPPDWAFLEGVHYQAARSTSADGATKADTHDERPYVGIRRTDAGAVSEGVWRIRHLPRRDQ